MSVSVAPRISTYLTSFLSKKRNNTIPPPPEESVFEDTYLKVFHDTLAHKNSLANLIPLIADEVVVNTTEADSSDNNVSIEASNTAIKLRNLPYKMTADEIIKIIKNQLKLEVLDVSMDIDAKTKLPAGSATILIDKDANITEFIDKLISVEYGGRKVSAYNTDAKQSSNNKKLFSSSDGRYFGVGTQSDVVSTVKCFLCGESGHKQNECVNPPLPTPCHLCAGTDHDACK